MREILFRGKMTSQPKWVEGDLIRHGGFKNNPIMIWPTGWTGAVEVIPETVGQYSGMQDKNKENIFEDDIVECWFPGAPHDMVCKQEIMFVDGCFGCGDQPLKIIVLSKLLIIGNTYDDSDLLK